MAYTEQIEWLIQQYNHSYVKCDSNFLETHWINVMMNAQNFDRQIYLQWTSMWNVAFAAGGMPLSATHW